MTEARVGLLCNIASSIQHSENNETLNLLRSYYLMRCKEITGGFGLPDKQFSTKVRCPHCCLEWNKDTEVNIKPLKPRKRQEQKIRAIKMANNNEKNVNERKKNLQSNQMEQICSFCEHNTITTLLKPNREYPQQGKTNRISKPAKNEEKQRKQAVAAKNKSDVKAPKIDKVELTKKSKTANVYSNAFDVFSLKNEQNRIASSIKEPRLIKNNKKKKDKFAGLCQKAVLASAKMKQAKPSDSQEKQNKLSLFLKPSSG